jgi:hypothetical protein
VLVADAHYDLGFMSMLERDGEGLRSHEEEALDRYVAAGDEVRAIRARQGLVLGVFLVGDYARALELEEANLTAFRRQESTSEVADSATLQSAILFRLGRPVEAWARMTEGLRIFSASRLYSGIARNVTMAAIMQLVHGDPALGARIAGAAHELARVHQVMLAPVKVLHLPDPADLAVQRFGADRAAELLAAGAAAPLDDAIAEVLAADPPGISPGVAAGSNATG